MKLSDALRGAADGAPVEHVSVSMADASRRVARSRALRTGSNGVVAVGAVAILGVGLIGPSFAAAGDSESFASADSRDMAAEESAPAMGADDAAGGGAAGESMLASPWLCGADFSADDPAWAYGDASGVSFEVGAAEPTDGGYEIERNLSASRPVDLISGGDYVVTWEGIIVGSYIEPDPVSYGPADEPSLPAGEVYERLDPATEFSSLQSWQVIDPVNCWDGAALPAGDYEVHLAQTLAYPVEVPTEEPSDEASEEATDAPAEDSAAENLPGAAMPEVFRVAAGPVALSVDGERVDDPFGAYLGHEEPAPVDPTDDPGPRVTVEPMPLPEPTDDPVLPPSKPSDAFTTGALTADVARQMFESAAVEGTWDMAAGSHRWIMNDASGPSRYYGCAWGGGDASRFPERTSTMELLDMDVDGPSSLSVSYGFVIDGNPEVTSRVTNASDFAIANYWSGQPQLYLVRDGRVVAEGYPQSIARGGDMVIMREEAGVASDAMAPDGVAVDGAEMLIAPAPDQGVLEPDETIAGTYLWRDVTRCDGGDGVEAGSYTLLSSTSLYVSDYDVQTLEGDAVTGTKGSGLLTEEVEPLVPPAGTGDGSSGSLGTDTAVAEPAPAEDVGEADWVDLQLWTSLGTVSVR